MSAHRKPPDGRPPASVADAAERLARIVDAAERAAAGVIDEAEREAQRHLDEARAAADRIVAERLRELADRLDPGGRDEGEGARPAHLRAVEAGSERRSEPAGPRLLATQLAVSGASRKEIDEQLRSRFGIEDPSGLLDAILGPEG